LRRPCRAPADRTPRARSCGREWTTPLGAAGVGEPTQVVATAPQPATETPPAPAAEPPAAAEPTCEPDPSCEPASCEAPACKAPEAPAAPAPADVAAAVPKTEPIRPLGRAVRARIDLPCPGRRGDAGRRRRHIDARDDPDRPPGVGRGRVELREGREPADQAGPARSRRERLTPRGGPAGHAMPAVESPSEPTSHRGVVPYHE
jgi:hypothetical protein